MAQLVASMSGVVLGGVVEVVGSNLARGKIFTASIGSVDSLYPSVFIYCLNLHQFLILCSSKAMMFVKLYIYTFLNWEKQTWMMVLRKYGAIFYWKWGECWAPGEGQKMPWYRNLPHV